MGYVIYRMRWRNLLILTLLIRAVEWYKEVISIGEQKMICKMTALDYFMILLLRQLHVKTERNHENFQWWNPKTRPRIETLTSLLEVSSVTTMLCYTEVFSHQILKPQLYGLGIWISCRSLSSQTTFSVNLNRNLEMEETCAVCMPSENLHYSIV